MVLQALATSGIFSADGLMEMGKTELHCGGKNLTARGSEEEEEGGMKEMKQ